jgi:hypothetical protein
MSLKQLVADARAAYAAKKVRPKNFIWYEKPLCGEAFACALTAAKITKLPELATRPWDVAEDEHARLLWIANAYSIPLNAARGFMHGFDRKASWVYCNDYREGHVAGWGLAEELGL